MLVDRKFMPKAWLLAATRTQNHAETGFLQEIARSPLPEKTGFLKICATEGSKDSRVYRLTLSSKSAPIRGENRSKQQPMQS